MTAGNAPRKGQQNSPEHTALGKDKSKAQVVLAAGELSREEEQALKVKHGRIRKVKVKLKEGGFSVCYCKYPDRDVIASAMTKRGQNRILEAGETILDNCFVAGDDQCKSVDAIRISAAMECYELLDFLEASSEDL